MQNGSVGEWCLQNPIETAFCIRQLSATSLIGGEDRGVRVL
jgi:hypothetical protein